MVTMGQARELAGIYDSGDTFFDVKTFGGSRQTTRSAC
jgi:hypothetical protein